ncbi:MAG: FAD-dependent oxidoreductase [Candidatus Aenigmarchaeota archaeon]|nr:FAD-dependent oxidoreductase [Candidatus Aenigmarchaeota archaeon]
MKTVIVGAGPAGLFAAKVLSDEHEVTIIDRMPFIGGAGLHSDGKLNFHPQIGGNLLEFMNQKKAWELIKSIESFFVEMGADPPEFMEKEMKELEIKALKAGIKFIPIRQTHIGSDNLPNVMKNIREFLESKGVEFLLRTEVKDLVVEDRRVSGIVTEKEVIEGDYFLIAPGRSGFEWMEYLVKKYNLNYFFNPIDIGVRVEVLDEVFKELVEDFKIWDPKFHIMTESYDDFVRTFCTNPSGFVVKESYGNSLVGVNGHAMKKTKSVNTNFAFLVRINLTQPLENTTAYGKRIAQLTNTLGGGKPLIQRLGDLKKHRRSTWERIRRSYVEPTLKDVTPGDIAMAYPERVVTDILEGLKMLDRVVPGVFSDSTLLYAPEIKFHAIRPTMNKNLQSLDIPNLFFAGDGAGVSRGIVGAAATGVIAGEGILKVSKSSFKH